MDNVKRIMAYALMLALLLAALPARARQAEDSLAALAESYVPYIGKSEAELAAELGDSAVRADENGFEAELDERALLAGGEYGVVLMYSGDELYGVRFERRGLDAECAQECARALIELARAEYGEPDTYPAGEASSSAGECWYFVRPARLSCEISIRGDEAAGYGVCVQFALSALPNVEYALSGEAAPYIEQLGSTRADACAALGLTEAGGGEIALEPVELLGVEYAKSLQFGTQSGALAGVEYEARGVEDISGAAGALYMQISQEYGGQDAAEGAEPFVQALAGLQAGDEVAAVWSLHTYDGSLPGLRAKLTAGVASEGEAYIRFAYALDGAA